MQISDFDYTLPKSAIAQAPVPERDSARLLVHELKLGRTRHLHVRDLPFVLAPGDLLVLNDTKVRAARLFARRPRMADGGGGRVELLLVESVQGEEGAAPRWRALVRPAGGIRAGETLVSERGGLRIVARERLCDAAGAPGPEWVVEFDGERTGPAFDAALEAAGDMPLPPYVRRAAGAVDSERYQTVFARERGAIAAPTAGLHFTPRLFEDLDARGVTRVALTLHVGLGTFRPVTADDPREHTMHAEPFCVPPPVAQAWGAARERGARVVAVGTTVVRALESSLDERGRVQTAQGETRAYFLPGHRFRAVDGLLTNFHLPRSTLLMLVCAFAGRERTLELYGEAIAQGYRFYSYGDAMLLLP